MPEAKLKPQWGISFARRQCEFLGLDWREALGKLRAVGFTKVRLSSYWSEIESTKDSYDFSLIKQELDLATEQGMEVTLTVGMKAQRWPEFYLPGYVAKAKESELSERVQQLLMVLIPTFKSYGCIKRWQVENEPLDPSGPDNKTVPAGLLQLEVDLVKQLDPTRPILLNAWGNDLKSRGTVNKFLKLSNYEFLGFDFYPRQFAPLGFRGPDLSLGDLNKKATMLAQNGITPIITELQAEPWEEEGDGGFDYRQHPERITSISPELIKQSIQDYSSLGFAEIYLWGAEYWIWSGIETQVAEILR